MIEILSEDEQHSMCLGTHRFDNATEPHNNVMSLGYNADGAGVRIATDEVALRDSWHGNALEGGTRYAIRSFHYQSSDGATQRQISSMAVNRSTHAVSHAHHGQFDVLNSAGDGLRLRISDVASPTSTADMQVNRCTLSVVPASGVFVALRIIDAAESVYCDAVSRDSDDFVRIGGLNAAGVRLVYTSTTRIEANATGLGFFSATPVAKPTVSGSRGGNAALASLLTALANLGLITDSTTA